MKNLFRFLSCLILFALPIYAQQPVKQGPAAQGTAGWPVIAGNLAKSTAAWTSGTSSNTALTANVTNYSTVVVTLNQGTTITGGVITFEVSDSSGFTNAYPILANQSGVTGITPASTYTLQDSVNASFTVNVGAWTAFRVRLSTIISGSGTVNVGVLASALPTSFAASLTGGSIFVRTQDGAGNGLTSNSSTYSSKVALDINLLGSLGTAFSVPGKIDVKAADGDMFIRQTTGTNLHMVCDSGCSSSAGFGDNSAFTPGTTAINPVGGLFNDGLGAVASGNAAVARMTSDRALYFNLHKIGGTAVDTNSGNKSAGTIRVILATDQPQLTNPFKVDGSGVTQPISAAALPLPTGAAADASVIGLQVSQGSTTSGQKGGLDQAAVSTNAPSYSTGQTDPLSLDVLGNLRVSLKDSPANTNNFNVAVQSVPANQSVNVSQVGGSSVSTSASGVQKVGMVGNAGASVDSPVGAGTAPTNQIVVGQVYNSTNPAPTNGQALANQADLAGNQKVAFGSTTQNLSAWSSGTSLNATQTVVTQASVPAVIVQLNQTTTLTAGAVTFELTYDDTNWITVPASQVMDPGTLAQISIPYTVQASTNKPFLITLEGARQVRAKLSTQITGSGTVTPFVTNIAYQPTRAMNSSGAAKVEATQATGSNLHVVCDSGCSGSGGTSSNFGSAVPSAGTASGYSDGTNMQAARVFDADSGGGTQYLIGTLLKKPASGGSVDFGTNSDPVRVDPVGTTSQPVTQSSGANLHVNIDNLNANGQNTMANSAPVAFASDQSKLPVKAASGDFASGSIADGAEVTLGAKADAKSTATDTTAITIMQVLKEISAMAQAPAALPANQSTNIAQVAGTALDTNSGNKSAGTPRIVEATDAPAQAAKGTGATGSASPAGAQYIAGNGSGNLTGKLQCDSYAFYDASTNGATQLVALSSTKVIYVCGYSFTSSSTTANTLKLVYGTGSNCATGQTAMTPGTVLQAATSTGPVGKVIPPTGDVNGLKTAASNALCVLTNAAQAAQVEVWYTQF